MIAVVDNKKKISSTHDKSKKYSYSDICLFKLLLSSFYDLPCFIYQRHNSIDFFFISSKQAIEAS